MSERREEVKDVIYTGKEPFDKFDRQVSRWARRRFKGLHGSIWTGWTPKITESNHVRRCREIYRCLLKVSPKLAVEAWKDESQYTKERAKDWWTEAQLDLYEYLDEVTDGDANDRLNELKEAADLKLVRNFFMKEYAGASSEELHELETYYKAGMPNKDGIAFPERCNMIEKLNLLEKMRVKLRGKAPTDMRDQYEFGKIEMLIRIVKEHAPAIYTFAIDGVFERHKMMLELQGEDLPDGINAEDFSDDHLPPYKKLREALIKTWRRFSKVWDSNNGTNKGASSLPTMLTPGGVSTDLTGSRDEWRDLCLACKRKGCRMWKASCPGYTYRYTYRGGGGRFAARAPSGWH